MKRAVRKFYTLIEIMTVIVIAAILFGIGIPAFTTMIQGSNMTVAIRQLSAKISAARAYAVTNRCKVAVLLMDVDINNDATSDIEKKLNPDQACSAYRVCIVNGESSPFTFQEWIEDENWKTLPTGILRNMISSRFKVKFSGTNDKKALEEILGEISSDTEIPGLIFFPNGQMKQREEITLYHGRGIKDGDKIKGIKTEGTDHKLTINQYSGKVTVSSDT